MKTLAFASGRSGLPPVVATSESASIVRATADSLPDQPHALTRARAFAEPLIAFETLENGENTLAHADAVAAILRSIGGSEAMQAASYLVYCCQHLARPQEVIAKAFGSNFAALAMETTKLVNLQRQARTASVHAQLLDDPAAQTENVRKMLLAFSRDLRVVMLRMASRLQTLRFHAATKTPAAPSLAHESLHVFAPLANRLGIWQIKWEMEDLAFRFLEPAVYQQTARLLDEKRAEREEFMEALRLQLERELNQSGIAALVRGRPKHIYSIVKKMRGKSLGFEQVFDVRALRVIAADVKGCYAALGLCIRAFRPLLASSTTTSPNRRPMATSHCIRWCAMKRAGRSKFRFARKRCMTTPSMAWPRTGLTKRPAPRAMRACRPAANTTPRLRCCGNFWPGSVTCPGRRHSARASQNRDCLKTAFMC